MERRPPAATTAPLAREPTRRATAATRVRAEDESDRPEQLRAWTTFPDWTTDHPGREYLGIAPRGANEPSPAVRNVITGACCGWAEPPTAGEAERAMRGREATDRNFCIATTVIGESEIVDVMRAEAEGAYTFQDLAWWIHEIGPPYRQDLVHWLNAVIEPVPPDAQPALTTPGARDARRRCRSG